MISSNLTLARCTLELLCNLGVDEFVLCAGARNAPLVQLLSLSQNSSFGLKIYSFVDERSAAFFALGRSRASLKPVAILTTSGTAAAELLPATIEAYYTGVPICLVTADRPARFQKSGAPQTIEQVGLFSHYVERAYDWSEPQECSPENLSWSLTKPLHINLRFEEPKWESQVEPFDPRSAPMFDPTTPRTSLNSLVDSWRNRTDDFVLPTRSALDSIKSFLKCNRNTVVMVGTLPSERVARCVQKLLNNLKIPFYAEAASYLRGSCDHPLELCSSEKVLDDPSIKSFLRIGGIPTARKWRDLDEQREVSLLSMNHLPFRGLAHGELIQVDWNEWTDTLSQGDLLEEPLCISNWSPEELVNLMKRDHQGLDELEQMWSSNPHTEPALFRKLSKLILKKQNQLFLGNSLTLRNWDLAALRSEVLIPIGTNRGANGIDGILSTFLGWADDQKINWLIMGDLTALYDLNGLWALFQRPHLRVCIVIINNGGGMIFRSKFGHPLFENRHKIHFNQWAAMWGVDYSYWDGDIPEKFEPVRNHIIEITVDPATPSHTF